MPITLAQKTISQTLRELPAERAAMALEFIHFLKARDEEDQATDEILANKKIVKDIRTARRDWAKGAHRQFSTWEKIRRS